MNFMLQCFKTSKSLFSKTYSLFSEIWKETKRCVFCDGAVGPLFAFFLASIVFILLGCERPKVRNVNISDLPRIDASILWGVHIDGPPSIPVHIVDTNLYVIEGMPIDYQPDQEGVASWLTCLRSKKDYLAPVELRAKADTHFENLWKGIEVCSSNVSMINLAINVTDSPVKKNILQHIGSLFAPYRKQLQYLPYLTPHSINVSSNMLFIGCGKNRLYVNNSECSVGELEEMISRNNRKIRSGELIILVLPTPDCSYQEAVKVMEVLHKNDLSRGSYFGPQPKDGSVKPGITLRLMRSQL